MNYKQKNIDYNRPICLSNKWIWIFK